MGTMQIPSLLSTLALAAAPQSAVETAPPGHAALGELPAGHVHEALHLVSIEGAPTELPRLLRLDLDTIESELAEGRVVVLANDEELAEIRDEARQSRTLRVTVDVEDLAAHYARRLNVPNTAESNVGNNYGQWLNPAFGQGGMGGYYTFAEIVSVVDQFRAQYPNLVSPKTSLGQSVQGRDIWMFKVSDNPTVDENEPEVRIDSLHHAREPQGMQTTIFFVSWLLEEYGTDPLATYLLNEREIYVVPCVNPDGYEYNRSQAPGGGGLWRKNRRSVGGGDVGVDLNRNYPFQWGGPGASTDPGSETYRGPSAGSEPETMAMTQFIAGRTFETALSVHTFSDVWLAPWGYVEQFPPDWTEIQEVGDAACEFNGYPHGPASIVLYVASGTTLDHDYGTNGTFAWTPEIGSSQDGFWPAQSRIVPLAEQNRLAFARTALAAGAWLNPLDAATTDEGDGDGTIEAGELVGVTARVRNSGRGAASTAQMTLSSPSAFATVVSAQSSVSAAPFTTGQNQGPLTFGVAPGTPNGTVIPFTVDVVDGANTFSIEGDVIVGVRVVASFDFEAGGNEGWGVGAPNDASTGEWERGDPNGTAAQPENDNTPNPGVNCWFTGQASVGASVGTNDVDDGTTTLVSPAFDLSGTQSATISYARWYSNDEGGNPNADVFEVDLSDDGGATWTAAEVIGPSVGASGGWSNMTLDVGSFVDLTSNVRIRFLASDLAGGSIVEAAIDDVVVRALDDASCPSPVNYCVLSPNFWTNGAVIGSTGSTDVAQNDLTLTVTDANPLGFGLFFYGQGRAQQPIGNGFICIGAGFTRLPVVMTDSAGFATFDVDFPSLSAPIQNGETWNFQFWMRDMGGSGFNFSDGLEITFCTGG